MLSFITPKNFNPFFTTYTGSALRGIEVEADIMLKGTLEAGSHAPTKPKTT